MCPPPSLVPISSLRTVYLAEGASTSVESPVVITCLCVFWQDAVEDFPVELLGFVQYPGHPYQNPHRDLHCDASVDGPSTSSHLTCTHRLLELPILYIGLAPQDDLEEH